MIVKGDRGVQYAASEIRAVDDRRRRLTHAITALVVDRDGDVVAPRGGLLEEFRQSPSVFFNHVSWGPAPASFAIGKNVGLEVTDTELIAETEFAGLAQRQEHAETIYRLYRDDFMRSWSMGFRIVKETREKLLPTQTGRGILEWLLLEYSAVGIPSNPDARTRMIKAFGLPDGATEHDFLEAAGLVPLKKWWDLALPILGEGAAGTCHCEFTDGGLAPGKNLELCFEHDGVRMVGGLVEEDPLRWNPDLSKSFDVSREPLEPSRLEYRWVSQYLEVEVKDLHQGGTFVPSARMGSWLSALEEALLEWSVDAVRNLTESGREAPPKYEVIPLNSTRSQDFLVHGVRFLRSPSGKCILKVEPDWAGLEVTTYTPMAQREVMQAFMNRVAQRAKELNFLKGEAFSLGGKFLPRTEERWADLFLESETLAVFQRVVKGLADQGAALEPRGILVMGPPGTGKTLTGRVMMNEAAETTFIWLAARDFYRAGAYGGLTYAFDLAAECAPAIVFVEDIDSWLDRSTVDLLKTEMDGIRQRSGLVTVLTTNYPDRLPTALVDRPGRFHDVLRMGLPTEAVRTAMLERWLPELTGEERVEIVQATGTMSGAHLKELARFARLLQTEQGGLLIDAVRKALEKLESQRTLVSQAGAQDRPYQPSKAVEKAVQQRAEKVGFGARRSVKSLMGYQETGFTKPAAGATAPLHVHDYCLSLDEMDGTVKFRGGEAYGVADHSHRITLESLMRGETEPADGHVHGLMTVDQTRQVLVGEDGIRTWMNGNVPVLKVTGPDDQVVLIVSATQQISRADADLTEKWLVPALERVGVRAKILVFPMGWTVKEGRVLNQTNFNKLAAAHATIGEVLASARKPKPEDYEEDPEKEPARVTATQDDLNAFSEGLKRDMERWVSV